MPQEHKPSKLTGKLPPGTPGYLAQREATGDALADKVLAFPCGCTVRGAGSFQDQASIEHCDQHAAAPDLLAALLPVSHNAATGNWGPDGIQYLVALSRPQIEAIRTAIAKAKGMG